MYYADLHIHSRFSRATSPTLNPEHLSAWAQMKGIGVVGTGDCIHPGWLKELREKMEPSDAEGLFRLKPGGVSPPVPPACKGEVRFILSTEIASIYKKGGRVRKIHNVIVLPGWRAAERLQSRLARIGNISSDGRPIIGLDAHDLLDMTLESDPQSFLIPAHIWTPWFSVLGSKSGFDSLEECFEDLTEHIFAVETGLSSDPEMNWRLSVLDRFVMVSSSDAHSPQKLGREATIFDGECSYPAMRTALRDNTKDLVGTVEFFPEEGKYHVDGHRLCQCRLDPVETAAHEGLCPVCGKPVTVGVMARVEALADHPPGRRAPRARPYDRLVPLAEIIAEARGTGVTSKAVGETYATMLVSLGNELAILRERPLAEIAAAAGARIAEGVRRVRAGELQIAAGYDGEYGTISIFSDDERRLPDEQLTLF